MRTRSSSVADVVLLTSLTHFPLCLFSRSEQRLLAQAKEVIACYPSPAVLLDEEEETGEQKAAKRRYHRAKRLLQVLS